MIEPILTYPSWLQHERRRLRKRLAVRVMTLACWAVLAFFTAWLWLTSLGCAPPPLEESEKLPAPETISACVVDPGDSIEAKPCADGGATCVVTYRDGTKLTGIFGCSVEGVLCVRRRDDDE